MGSRQPTNPVINPDFRQTVSDFRGGMTPGARPDFGALRTSLQGTPFFNPNFQRPTLPSLPNFAQGLGSKNGGFNPQDLAQRLQSLITINPNYQANRPTPFQTQQFIGQNPPNISQQPAIRPILTGGDIATPPTLTGTGGGQGYSIQGGPTTSPRYVRTSPPSPQPQPGQAIGSYLAGNYNIPTGGSIPTFQTHAGTYPSGIPNLFSR